MDEESFEDAAETLLHADAHEEGGLAMNNRALLEQQRGAIFELIRDMGKQLLTGNINLVNMSMPVKMFEPRSYLQKLSDVWVHSRILLKAAACDDPMTRLKWMITWFVAGLQHVFQSWRKPFNPILGETWQATLDDGTTVFFEQISHHPPVSAFQMIGPGNEYEFAGYSQPEVQYKGNAVKTTARGKRRVKFADGSMVEITYPKYYLRGILYTSRPRGDIGGTARFVDAQHGLCCEVNFGKVQDATDKLLQRPDAFSGSIFRYCTDLSAVSNGLVKKELKPRKSLSGLAKSFHSVLSSSSVHQPEPQFHRLEEMSTCSGNWLSHLDWEGQRYWTLAEDNADSWHPSSNPLPSDSRFREDLQCLLDESPNWQIAQAAKEKLETRQRTDAKLRKEASRSAGA
ncbi:Oxysterol-binding protein-related protein 8 at N-terminal half [Coccomyxa sp. Obi]|nr:Oxysterol-binding protein-related protein 8 at N-terminal half [Coccomyxa sp. Obi]